MGRFSEGAKKIMARRCSDSAGFQGGILSPMDLSPKTPKRRNSAFGPEASNCKDLKASTGFTTFAMRDVPLSPMPISLKGGRRHSAHSVSFTDFKSLSTPSTNPAPKAATVAIPCGSAVNAIKDIKDRPVASKWGILKDHFKLQKCASDTDLAGRRLSLKLPPMAHGATRLPPLDKELTSTSTALSAQMDADPSGTGNSNEFDRQTTIDSADGETKDDSENTGLPDISFVVPDSPTFMEALQRFQSGTLFDNEVRRIHRAFRRFTGKEEDLGKESLDLVTSHLGYILVPEDDMEIMANNVSDMSSFDVEELLSFLQGCSSGQTELVEAAFQKQVSAEESTTGTISLDGLAVVMKELHLITLRDNLNELLHRASISDKISFTLDDVARVLAAYRTCEGFTGEALKEAQEKYDEATEEKPLTVLDLPNALLDFFGVHCVKQLRELVEAAGEALSYCGTHTCPVSFHEYLVWARHLQNAFLLELCEHFENEDGDEDGKVTFDEMIDVMKRQGFTLSRVEAIEFIEAAGLEMEEDTLYSFDDVHSLLESCRENEGFMEKDLEELKDVYKKFDTEEEGELTTLQVLDLLRFLGYQVQVSEVEYYAKQVDFNLNGTMDEDEYMRLMRLHREDEIADMQRVFFHCVGSCHGRLPFGSLHDALKAAKCCSSHCDVFNDICQAASIDENTVDFSFDEFRVLADQGRKSVKLAQRKKANFSDAEFAVLQQAFVEFDTLGEGKLEHGRLLMLLHSCGVPVQTEETQRWGVDMLDKARENARRADLCEDMVGKVGTGSITFWSMIHAWRMITRTNEEKTVARFEDARAMCNFSVAEAEEFRKIFTEKTQPVDSEERVEAPAPEERSNSRRRSMPDLYTATPKDMQETTRQMLDTAKTSDAVKHRLTPQQVIGTNEALMSFHDLKQILGLLHLKLGPKHVYLLEQEMYTLTGDNEGALDFPNFLRIMRWMLDTDFAHLNNAAATVAKTVEKTVTATKAASVDEKQEGLLAETPKAGKLLGRRASV
jgi:Ca2+-binding EF-hand superfamily protein